MIKRLGILTGGGDAHGLNAVTPTAEAVVKTACREFTCDVVGIEDAYDGLLMPDRARPLTFETVHGLLGRGGTILGAANRGIRFARKVIRGGQEVLEDITDQGVESFRRLGLDGLIVVGGDGTLRIAQALRRRFNLPIVALPKTFDDDLNGTDVRSASTRPSAPPPRPSTGCTRPPRAITG